MSLHIVAVIAHETQYLLVPNKILNNNNKKTPITTETVFKWMCKHFLQLLCTWELIWILLGAGCVYMSLTICLQFTSTAEINLYIISGGSLSTYLVPQILYLLSKRLDLKSPSSESQWGLVFKKSSLEPHTKKRRFYLGT